MSHVTDVVAMSNHRHRLEKVADLLDKFYQRRYSGVEFESQGCIIDCDHPEYDNLQVGPKVGGANILWFTLNHQSANDFVDLLRSENVTNVTLWIDDEYEDGSKVVTL